MTPSNEIRVYMVNSDNNVTNLTDEEFMTIAEQEGTVYSLADFELEFNAGESFQSFIRILTNVNNDPLTPKRNKCDDLCMTVSDITQIAEKLGYSTPNSKTLNYIDWAQEFEKKNEGVEWAKNGNPEYLEAVNEFTTLKVKNNDPLCEVYKAAETYLCDNHKEAVDTLIKAYNDGLEDDLADSVLMDVNDELAFWEPFEYKFTVKEFLEEIWYFRVTNQS